MKKVIGSVGLCNVASLNVYEINEKVEKILAGVNDQNPTWYKLYYTNKGVYFNYGRSRYYLHEIVKTVA